MRLSQTHSEGATHGSKNFSSSTASGEIVSGIYASVSHSRGLEARPSGDVQENAQVPLGNSAAGTGVGLDDVELRRIAGRTLRSSQGVLRGVSAKATPAREHRRGLAEGAGPVADGGAAGHRHRRSSAHRGAIADGRRWLYSSGLRWLAANVFAGAGLGRSSGQCQCGEIGADHLADGRGASAFGSAMVLAVGPRQRQRAPSFAGDATVIAAAGIVGGRRGLHWFRTGEGLAEQEDSVFDSAVLGGERLHGSATAAGRIQRWRSAVLDEGGAKQRRGTVACSPAVCASAQARREQEPRCLVDDERRGEMSQRGAGKSDVSLALGERRLVSDVRTNLEKDDVGKSNREAGASRSGRKHVGVAIAVGARRAGNAASCWTRNASSESAEDSAGDPQGNPVGTSGSPP